MSQLFNQGDIIYLDFEPTKGHEQSGHRPAVVVTNIDFQRTNLLGVVPITNTVRNHPLHVKLDSRTYIQGEIMCEQFKSVDYVARKAKKVELLPQDLLDEVTTIIKSFF
ncbi:type II toxin-antitoxin system PemK/MazF family toxin [Paenibacillus nicotianae]|uniref:Type II toxin-antitoxin system PemK/MazF family toxin n=1 Tax=Paenibacillus nicotianae TaxID=1526551 RepID=A0ABW4V2Q2_9BACL